MTETQITDVLIGGAGPVGLTLASDLTRRGIACRIIDQEATYHTGRAAGLSPRTQEIFEDLGLLEQISAHTAPIPGASMIGTTRSCLSSIRHLTLLSQHPMFPILEPCTSANRKPRPCCVSTWHRMDCTWNWTAG